MISDELTESQLSSCEECKKAFKKNRVRPPHRFCSKSCCSRAFYRRKRTSGKAWRRKNGVLPVPGKYHYLNHILRKYNLTSERLHDILEKQKGKCVGCDRALDGKFRIDHCHNTNIVRGLLCPACNMYLGAVNDDPNRIRKLLAYAERNILFSRSDPSNRREREARKSGQDSAK